MKKRKKKKTQRKHTTAAAVDVDDRIDMVNGSRMTKDS